jgi:hypothetical protein
LIDVDTLLFERLANFRDSLVAASENYDTNGVPAFNTDRAQTLASLDRAKKIVAGSRATVIIQHDARDLDKIAGVPGFREVRIRGQPPGIQIGGRCGALLD